MQSSSATGPIVPVHGGNPDLMVAAEIGATLTATASVPDLVDTLHRKLKWLLPATHISLCLLEEDAAYYKVFTPARAGRDGSGQRYAVSEGAVGWALRHRTALDIPDLQDETRLPPGLGGVALDRGTGALLILPLSAENRLLGVLAIGSPQVGAYLTTDRGIINLIVLQVAAALRMILLMAELDGAEAIIAGMARAVEAKDPYTQGHAERVTAYALALAEAAALPTHIRDLVLRAGPLHDVGKIGVPDGVLGKPGRLTDEEFALVKRHPVIGDEICMPLRSLRRLRPGIRHHHERYDGRGYPDGLAGQEIPLEARVLAIADTFDAMTSTRPYRDGMPVAQALAIIGANEGPQWDPTLTPIFRGLHSPTP